MADERGVGGMESLAGPVGLLRHGDTGCSGFRGRLDDPLTPLGWRQMEAALAEGEAWAAVASSPLRRCAAFASWYAERQGLPLRLDARLAELDFGAWEGATPAQLMASEAGAEALGRFWRDPWGHPPPGGERLDAFEARTLAAVRDAARAANGRPALAVTHGGVIRVLLRLWRGLPRAGLLAIEIPHGALRRLEPAA